jgi:DTW domain-containing protein
VRAARLKIVRAPLVDQSRSNCPRCRQPMSGCWCERIEPRATRERIVFLQHPREARNTLGTARMAHLALEGSALLIGTDFSQNAEFRRILEESREGAVVLFPAEGARDVGELRGREPAATIIVIDGTWWQAQKIWKSNPVLRALPSFRIEPRQPSQYGFRSEPEPHCISTIEAVAELLDALSVDVKAGTYEAFLAPFRALVDRQLAHAKGPHRAPRRRLRARPHKPFVLPAPFDTQPERAVLFFAEGNGWPASMDPRPPTEVLQAMAVRPTTGEVVGSFVRPSRGLSPTALKNLGIGEEALQGWLEPADLRERFRAFSREGDAWLSWGHFSAGLLAGTGLDLPSLVYLRPIFNRLLHAKVGAIEKAHRRFELAPVLPLFPGRGGLRLAMLVSLWRYLLDRLGSEGLNVHAR